ncbi:E3 ubiquitin-protein ligase mycbp2, partial [Halocaridina rubra]
MATKNKNEELDDLIYNVSNKTYRILSQCGNLNEAHDHAKKKRSLSVDVQVSKQGACPNCYGYDTTHRSSLLTPSSNKSPQRRNSVAGIPLSCNLDFKVWKAKDTKSRRKSVATLESVRASYALSQNKQSVMNSFLKCVEESQISLSGNSQLFVPSSFPQSPSFSDIHNCTQEEGRDKNDIPQIPSDQVISDISMKSLRTPCNSVVDNMTRGSVSKSSSLLGKNYDEIRVPSRMSKNRDYMDTNVCSPSLSPVLLCTSGDLERQMKDITSVMDNIYAECTPANTELVEGGKECILHDKAVNNDELFVSFASSNAEMNKNSKIPREELCYPERNEGSFLSVSDLSNSATSFDKRDFSVFHMYIDNYSNFLEVNFDISSLDNIINYLKILPFPIRKCYRGCLAFSVKGDGGGSNATSTIMPVLALPGNPSSFAVYAHVRGLVLENAARQAQSVYLTTTQPLLSESDTDDDTDKGKEPVLQIPKMVGLGLVSVYELIRGSVSAYPALCIRALEALLDILQGQQPEALQAEPPEVIDALFNLLLRLATASNGDVLTCPSSPLVGVACACLLSLVVARGESGKFLRATADILMTSRQLASQSIQVPIILTFLQRSVHAVLLGKTSRPDWLTGGVPKSSLIDKFSVKIMTDGEELKEESAMTCDGQYLYIHNAHGLFKIGSGFGGSMKGHTYMHRPDFYPKQKGWLGFAHGDVFYRPEGSNGELVVIDREILRVSEVYQCSSAGWCRGLPFSDGINIGHISPDREDGFVVRTYNPLVKPMPMVNELGLSLAIRCIQVFGGPEQQSTLSAGVDEDILAVASGKEFTLIRTTAGRVHFSGKASSVGMKLGSSSGSAGGGGSVASGAAVAGTSNGGGGGSGTPGPSASSASPNKWPELSVTKSPRIIHMAVGHEGQHAVLLSDEGAAFFVGTARRGEDGDSSKGRRQPKPVKPKKMIKLDGQFVVNAACNNGTSALVSRDGEMYMFGKDTLHCDSTGLVTELRDVHVTSVSLGKAHALALTNKGHVYSFGINNKGQCGRDFIPQIKEGG